MPQLATSRTPPAAAAAAVAGQRHAPPSLDHSQLAKRRKTQRQSRNPTEPQHPPPVDPDTLPDDKKYRTEYRSEVKALPPRDDRNPNIFSQVVEIPGDRFEALLKNTDGSHTGRLQRFYDSLPAGLDRHLRELFDRWQTKGPLSSPETADFPQLRQPDFDPASLRWRLRHPYFDGLQESESANTLTCQRCSHSAKSILIAL